MPKRATPRVKRHAFYAALEAMGCTFCDPCGQFMYPDHTEHVAGVRVDLTKSRYVVVGTYGDVKLVDLESEATVAEVAVQLPDQEDTTEMTEAA